MATIKVIAAENGPYRIAGNATFTDAEGNEQQTSGTRVALCRCGHSGNKPFCDGAHKKVGFTAAPIELDVNVE